MTVSDDGSRLWIDGKKVVKNMGLHGRRARKGTVTLDRGFHEFKAYHFENGGGSNMVVKYRGADTSNRWALVEGSHDGEVDEVDIKKG
jgi:hypothetical protein